MRVGIIGASGYTGLELVRCVLRHPKFELVAVTSEQRAGLALGDAFPGFRGLVDLRFEAVDPDALASRLDCAFVALPHGASAKVVSALHKAGVAVVDLSADFRLQSREVFEKWYGEHAAPELFGQAVYGLPELHRDELPGARLIAAPGCYPTSAILPAAPFLRAGVVESAGLFVDSKSGVSGAGRKLDEGLLLAEIGENARAYSVAAHRHGPEIEQELGLVGGQAVSVSFVPQLIPVVRGILTTVGLRPAQPITTAEAQALLEAAYADAPFVRVLPVGEFPSLQAVRGSNFCDVAVVSDERAGTLLALSALDNLVKGSGGQAIQAFNLAQGWPETTGLWEAPWLP
ncbi:MAG: N-acetyl-gamma-glutamyl-phosphate reductase [Myxococcota bacterium]